MLGNMLPCKTTLTENTIAVMVAGMSQSRSTCNPGACAYSIKTPLKTIFVVNSVKLHLTALKYFLSYIFSDQYPMFCTF